MTGATVGGTTGPVSCRETSTDGSIDICWELPATADAAAVAEFTSNCETFELATETLGQGCAGGFIGACCDTELVELEYTHADLYYYYLVGNPMDSCAARGTGTWSTSRCQSGSIGGSADGIYASSLGGNATYPLQTLIRVVGGVPTVQCNYSGYTGAAEPCHAYRVVRLEATSDGVIRTTGMTTVSENSFDCQASMFQLEYEDMWSLDNGVLRLTEPGAPNDYVDLVLGQAVPDALSTCGAAPEFQP